MFWMIMKSSQWLLHVILDILIKNNIISWLCMAAISHPAYAHPAWACGQERASWGLGIGPGPGIWGARWRSSGPSAWSRGRNDSWGTGGGGRGGVPSWIQGRGPGLLASPTLGKGAARNIRCKFVTRVTPYIFNNLLAFLILSIFKPFRIC